MSTPAHADALLRAPLPTRWLDEARFAALRPAWLSAAAWTRLRETTVARADFERWLCWRLDLAPLNRSALSAPSKRVAAALDLWQQPVAASQRLQRYAGAVHHAASLCALIDGNIIAQLNAYWGETPRRLARALSHQGKTARLPALEAQALISACERAGHAAFAAWCAELPRGLGQRLVLRLPPVAEPDPQAADPALIDSVVEHNK